MDEMLHYRFEDARNSDDWSSEGLLLTANALKR